MSIIFRRLLTILIFANLYNHVNSDKADNVRKKYCDMTCEQYSHTVCKRFPCTNARRCGASYKFDYLTDNERESILDLHNAYRNKQDVLITKYGIKEEVIVDMMQMKYRKEIEYIAACHVRDCSFNRGDLCRSYEKVICGQNLFSDENNYLWDTKYKGVLALNESFAKWIEQFKINSGCSSKNYSTCKLKEPVKNFIQIIWAKTELLGCAKMKSSRGVSVVCNYCPAGLVEGQPLFVTARNPNPSCGQDPRYKLLCGPTEQLANDKFYFPDLLVDGGGSTGGGFWGGVCAVSARVEVVTAMVVIVVFYQS